LIKVLRVAIEAEISILGLKISQVAVLSGWIRGLEGTETLWVLVVVLRVRSLLVVWAIPLHSLIPVQVLARLGRIEVMAL
jgi:hypothetical protein